MASSRHSLFSLVLFIFVGCVVNAGISHVPHQEDVALIPSGSEGVEQREAEVTSAIADHDGTPTSNGPRPPEVDEVQERLNDIKKNLELQLARLQNIEASEPPVGEKGTKAKGKGTRTKSRRSSTFHTFAPLTQLAIEKSNDQVEKIAAYLQQMRESLSQVVLNITDSIQGLENVEEEESVRQELISSLEEHLKKHHIEEHVQQLRKEGLQGVLDFETGDILDGADLPAEELEKLQEIRQEADPAVLHHDLPLLWEIAVLIVAAAFGGLLSSYCRLPPAFGYIVAGSIVGPSGLFIVKQFQKVETVSLFGSLFVLFAHGSTFTVKSRLEVEPQYLIGGGGTVLGTMILTTFSFFLCGLVGSLLEGYLLGVSSALSSTRLAIEFLQERHVSPSPFLALLRHIVAVQDLTMGLIMAAPAILAAESASLFWLQSLKAILSYLSVFSVLWTLTHYIIPRMFELVSGEAPKENEDDDGDESSEKSVVLLGMISTCLSVALLTELLGLSLEAGAFFAGLAFMRPRYCRIMAELVGPLDHLFGSMYFASIAHRLKLLLSGFLFALLNRCFIASYDGAYTMLGWALWQISVLAVQLWVIKVLVSYGVLRFFHSSSQDAMQGAVTLSQLGEFSLLFMSKAQSFNLVSRKIYLIYVVVTAIHLGLASLVKNLSFSQAVAAFSPSAATLKAKRGSPSHSQAKARQSLENLDMIPRLDQAAPRGAEGLSRLRFSPINHVHRRKLSF